MIKNKKNKIDVFLNFSKFFTGDNVNGPAELYSKGS